MQSIRPMETGVMFWAERDTLAGIRGMGVRCGQLGIAGDVRLTDAFAAEWKAGLAEHDFTLVTVFAAYNGESYADIPTVERTVGFIPAGTRARRVARTIEISDFAAAIGAPGIACHIGFVPEDESNADYIAVRAAVREVCDHAARYGQTFALETGQEPAATLLQFFKDVGRDNLRINFDPANMILYGTGDPIEALKLLAPHVISVHCKDGDWPPKDKPGALGTERPLGQGSVGIPRFVQTLREIGFQGSLNIERETESQEERLRDIRMAVALLKRLSGD
jgi:L-ribulose-5-phosphate 3-epimerase